MAFRRDEKERIWACWRRENNQLIAVARVPNFIVETRRNWLNFLDNGYLEERGPSTHSNYDIRVLPRDEQEKMLQLIETYPDGTESEAARRLRRLLKSAP
jgi:hypothetical protein